MKQFKRHPLRLAVVAAFLASSPLMAHAGDGPYIGAEGGANFEGPQNLNNTGDSLHFKTGWAAGLVGGYSFANGFRPELELDHRRNKLKDDAFGNSASGFENADSAMANLWYDFKAPSGLFSVVHPYVGGGVGGVRFANRGVDVGGFGFNNAFDTKFGYQGGAGVGFDVTQHLTLSADYRYIESNRGHFDVDPGVPISARYRAQTAMLGVRYSFGEEPAAPPPPPVCNPPAGFKVDANCHIIEQSLIIRAVDFEFNKAVLTVPAQQTLDGVASALAAQPELNVEIQGHTDSIGSAPYNLKLSQRRADSVKAYLVSKGVNGSNLTAHGYGKTKPIASNDTDEGRAQNRRVEFEVTNAPAHIKVLNEGATAASTDAAQQGPQPKSLKKHHHKKAAAPADPSSQPQ